MSVLRSIEQKIEGLFEGLFGRAFRTNVQPVELARKLVKEMDDHRTVSVSRIYVPNEYTVYLSPPDREQFADYEASLRTELQDYLAEHARREGYALLSPPDRADRDRRRPLDRRVRDRDPDGAARGRQRRRAGAGAAASSRARRWSTGRGRRSRPTTPPPDVALAQEIVTLTMDGTGHEVDKRRVVIGRSKDCDIQLADPNVSRRHAELRQEGSAYWLIDLDSTNGSQVNGRRTARAKLESGDTITIGSTELALRAEAASSDVASVAVGEALLILKIAVPAAALPLHLADRAHGQPRPAAAAGELRPHPLRRRPSGCWRQRRPARQTGRLVVSEPATVHGLDSRTGHRRPRSARTTSPLADDDFASARHARIEPRRDGVWVSDAGSTNGTYVNGARLSKPRRLAPGDVIRVGSTDLRFDRR